MALSVNYFFLLHYLLLSSVTLNNYYPLLKQFQRYYFYLHFWMRKLFFFQQFISVLKDLWRHHIKWYCILYLRINCHRYFKKYNTLLHNCWCNYFWGLWHTHLKFQKNVLRAPLPEFIQLRHYYRVNFQYYYRYKIWERGKTNLFRHPICIQV